MNGQKTKTSRQKFGGKETNFNWISIKNTYFVDFCCFYALYHKFSNKSFTLHLFFENLYSSVIVGEGRYLHLFLQTSQIQSTAHFTLIEQSTKVNRPLICIQSTARLHTINRMFKTNIEKKKIIY